MAIVELLRPVFYLWTSLPAPDIHCVTHNETHAKPTSMGEVLRGGGVMTQGCGDLVYSGHMSTDVACLLVHLHYAERTFGRHLRPLLRAWVAVLAACIVANAYVILSVRHHYTTDLVSAAIVSVLLWHYVGHVLTGWRDVHPAKLA